MTEWLEQYQDGKEFNPPQKFRLSSSVIQEPNLRILGEYILEYREFSPAVRLFLLDWIDEIAKSEDPHMVWMRSVEPVPITMQMLASITQRFWFLRTRRKRITEIEEEASMQLRLFETWLILKLLGH